jgi:hypothetical protein
MSCTSAMLTSIQAVWPESMAPACVILRLRQISLGLRGPRPCLQKIRNAPFASSITEPHCLNDIVICCHTKLLVILMY